MESVQGWKVAGAPFGAGAHAFYLLGRGVGFLTVFVHDVVGVEGASIDLFLYFEDVFELVDRVHWLGVGLGLYFSCIGTEDPLVWETTGAEALSTSFS